MPEATFTYSSDDALDRRILFHASEMSGTRATLVAAGKLRVVIRPPFDVSRLDNVENIIRGLAPDVVRR